MTDAAKKRWFWLAARTTCESNVIRGSLGGEVSHENAYCRPRAACHIDFVLRYGSIFQKNRPR